MGELKTKLEPCPICGKETDLSIDSMSNYPYKWVRCMGKHFNNDLHYGPVAITNGLAIKLWNSESVLRFKGIPSEHLSSK